MHTWTFALMLLAASAADKPTVAVPPHVRAEESAARLLAATTARSATVRDLVRRITATDVIVYVEMTASPQIPTARTKLVTATPGARFLRIGINNASPSFDWPALVAHELQHAVEIAEHPDVRDDEGMRRLYARIGNQHGIDSYETVAAQQVERQVRVEMRRRSPAS